MADPHRLALRAALTALACVCVAAPARASPRYAIVIGSNEGEPDEPALRFAERDAQRVADVLTRLGRTRPEDVLTLLSPSADDVALALAAFRARVGHAKGDGAMVVVYYSGHADERSLHLSGTRYPFARLKSDVRAIGADLSIFILDACRSGGLVRAKGASPSELFAFDVQDELAAEGVAIITSSAENEDAQESDRLAGGVFTHHLVTGLVGAADRSGDERVSLAEVYRYAYAQTLAATSATSIVQHPTYAFDVKGQNEIVLTDLGARTGRGRLHLESGGQYLVLSGVGHEVVAELEAPAATDLWLKPGPYLVRRREATAVYERYLLVAPDATVALSESSLARVPFRHAVRKGYAIHDRVVSVGGVFEVTSPILDQTGALLAGALALQVDVELLAVQARVRFGRSVTQHERVHFEQTLVGADLGIYHLFDVGPHGVGFGVRGGLDWFAQRFETAGVAPPVDQLIGRFGGFARGELAIGSAFTLTLDVGLEVLAIDLARPDGGASVEAQATLVSNIGLSGALPW